MPATKRAHSDADSIQSLTPPSSPTGPTTPLAKRETKPDVPSSDDDYAPVPTPTKVPKGKSSSQAQVTPKTPRAKKVKAAGQGDTDVAGVNGDFTPDKKEGIIEDLLAAGLKTMPAGELAAKYGLSKLQVTNALQAGRSNLRKKVVQAARGC